MPSFVIEKPSQDETEFLGRKLDEFNTMKIGRDDFQLLVFVVHDPKGRVIAGIKGMTGWDWLYIEILWVDEDHRRSGLGSRLLANAEEEAGRRGCCGACLMSCSFQAPEFYQRRGYSVSGQIDDYPVGHQMILLSKRLNIPES